MMLHFKGELKTVADKLKKQEAEWQRLTGALPADVTKLFCPTTLSVKVGGKTDLFRLLEANASGVEQVHIGTVNNRYIASAILKEPYEGMPIFKILERRPGSQDPLGLDSIDYLCDNLEVVFNKFKAAGLPVIKESNEVHAWLSLKFGKNDQYEAKFTDHLLTEVAIKELRLVSEQLLKG